MPVTVDDITQAAARIRGQVLETPCVYSPRLAEATGCELYLKLENFQASGSFKERGAFNKLAALSGQAVAGVVAASAGNHAQAVAHAAGLRGVPAVIVMPETTPLTKVRGTREYGAEVVLHGESYEAAFERARAIGAERGFAFIHAFDDPAVIAGQGTVGLEIIEQIPAVEAVVVPVGGGGLISGIATAVKARRPQAQVYGVEAERMPAMQASLAAGVVERLRPANTIADGICIARVGEHTLPIAASTVDGFANVSEDEIANGIVALLEREKVLAEGAGAVGLAALLYGRLKGLEGRRVVVVVSGGNIDMTLLDVVIGRGLETEGRVVQLVVRAPDRPARVAEIAAAIAESGASLVRLEQNRHVAEVELGEVQLTLTLETRGADHVHDIVGRLRSQGLYVE